ncbi:MAG: preprotein translocase subunit YajC [Candidatus Epulonipiscioides saccharophilum]|nr:MAG: preprotein translocase subunit YajC [Epulopiscium sp. AS2M-Bin001]
MSALIAIIGLLIYIGFFAGVIWLIIIRPQKKREKAILNMQSQIKVGESILLNNGLYGKVVEIINDLFIVEMGLNKSVRVPVKKSHVAGVQAPNMTVVQETVIDKIIDDSADQEYDDED